MGAACVAKAATRQPLCLAVSHKMEYDNNGRIIITIAYDIICGEDKKMSTEKQILAFEDRMKQAEDELRWLYMELYNDEAGYEYFKGMLRRSFEARSPQLRAWDEKRTEKGLWYKGRDILGMMLYTDRFAGNLNGVLEHLDYLEDLHINYLHLMPLLASPVGKSDGG